MKHAGAVLALLALIGCKSTPTTLPPAHEMPADVLVVRDVHVHTRDAALRADVSRDASRDAHAPASWTYATSGGIELANLSESALQSISESERNAAPAHTFAAVSERSGRAPTMASVLAALRAQVASSARFVAQGGLSALGEGRYVAVIEQTDPAYPRSPRLAVVTVSENASAAQIEGLAYVPTEGVWQAHGDDGCALTLEGRQVRDLDQDGELEISLAVRFCSQSSCPIGFTTYGYLAVFDLVPVPRLVAMVERSLTPTLANAWATRRRRTQWRDVNGDGHADLIVSGEDCQPTAEADAAVLLSRGCTRVREAQEGEPFGPWCCLARTETVLYDPATDAWREGSRTATQASEISCENTETEETQVTPDEGS
ncbi:MAG: hypothetical protein Q8Q09_00335 [Deltaproteobacteria bacterium]|nr:hypothetical protein [Deltaproteobacteria bacterium]